MAIINSTIIKHVSPTHGIFRKPSTFLINLPEKAGEQREGTSAKMRVRTMFGRILMTRHLLVALLFTVPAACVCAQAPSAPPSIDRTVDAYIDVQMHGNGITGLSLAVVKDGKLIKASGYGLANIETNASAKKETVYKLGSISKQFMATGIMLLVQDGALRLDDRVSKYIDGAPPAWQGITVRHLLTHTSGIVGDPPLFDPLKVQSDADVLKSAFHVPLQFLPGSKWDYSNTNYYALAEILRKVSGRPWSVFINDRIFVPAGMTHTRTTSISDIIPNRATGYETTPSGLVNAEVWSAIRPSGGFLSTAEDMARWDVALSSDVILTSSSKAQMFSPVELSDGGKFGYGFGWFVDSIRQHPRLHHDGALPGFKSDFERYPDDSLSVIVLTNSGSANVEYIAQHVASFYVSGLAPVLEPAIPDGNPDLTVHLKDMINGFITGDLDMTIFGASTAARIDSESKARWKQTFTSSGQVPSIILVEHKVVGQKQRLRYRLDYPLDSFFVICVFDQSGKIVGFGVDK